jgi:ABC-type transport system involved in Fe-S cluster assembly fused permease/ATPase subunit
MNKNNNEMTNEVRTEKWFSASVVTCFASFIGVVIVTSDSAAQRQNMTSGNIAAVNNALPQKEIPANQDTANSLVNLAASQPEANNPFDPFTNGVNK